MAVLRFPFTFRRDARPSAAGRCVEGGWGGAVMGVAATVCLGAGPLAAQTGPVLCTTSLEAPLIVPGQPLPASGGPREVTRCGAVGTLTQLVERRYFSYRAPFARGVDITHQLTDLFGLAMGGGDGTRLMGFGFPDQAIIWDGSAIENTSLWLMEQQTQVVPTRTADLPSPSGTSVRSEGRAGGGASGLAYPDAGLEPR